jgi:hypothetical protein
MAYLPLDGNAADLSGNGHGGTVHSAEPAPDRFDRPDGAYFFDGKAVGLTVTGIDVAGRSFSIAAWVRQAGPAQQQQIVFSQGVAAANRGLHIGFDPDRPFIFGFWDNDLDADSAKRIDAAWHLWTVTSDAAARLRAVYVDHYLLALDVPREDYVGTGPFYVGCAAWGTAHFPGWIDELRIYDGALAPDDVLRLYRESGQRQR